MRAGETSLHREWLGDDRNWDLVVSWYGDEPYEAVANETVVSIRGGLGDGIYKTYQALPELIDSYDYFWLPDDDIEADCASINRLFGITSQQDLELSQPALTHSSYFTYPHTLASPSFLLRYTSLVEVMAPCLSRERMKIVLPMFADNASLYGVDLVWARLDADNRGKAAIIDAATVRHTRPVSRHLAKKLKGGKDDPLQTKQRLLSGYGLSAADKGFKCYAGLARKDGSRRGALTTRLNMLVDYMGHFGQWKQPGAWWAVLRMFRRRPPNLSQLKPSAVESKQS